MGVDLSDMSGVLRPAGDHRDEATPVGDERLHVRPLEIRGETVVGENDAARRLAQFADQ